MFKFLFGKKPKCDSITRKIIFGRKETEKILNAYDKKITIKLDDNPTIKKKRKRRICLQILN